MQLTMQSTSRTVEALQIPLPTLRRSYLRKGRLRKSFSSINMSTGTYSTRLLYRPNHTPISISYARNDVKLNRISYYGKKGEPIQPQYSVTDIKVMETRSRMERLGYCIRWKENDPVVEEQESYKLAAQL